MMQETKKICFQYFKISFVFFLVFFFGKKINAQNVSDDNPEIENFDKRNIKVGWGLSGIQNDDSFTTLNMEIGYQRFWNKFIATSISLNYGFALEDIQYVRGLQAHSNFMLLLSPVAKDKKYIPRFGVGIIGIGVFDYYGYDYNESGLSVGYSFLFENEFKRKTKDPLFISLEFSFYDDFKNLIGITFSRGISFSNLKNNRRIAKSKLLK